MNTLVLIDGHAILHRAFHALPPLTNSRGEQVNAVFGFASMLLRIIEDLHPTHLAVVFDLPKPTFRKKLFADYQIKRPIMDEGLADQIPIVRRMLETMEISSFAREGYEADDVIGTIADRITNHESRITKKAVDIVIVTGDRDLLQLVNEHVKVYMPVKGLTESKLYGEKEVEEKFGLKPSQIIDYKALIGDQSDNYPGVPGIGPKTASGLLSAYETLESLYNHLDELESGKVRNLLITHKEQAFLSKKLATIVRDVPQTVKIEDCTIQDLDTEQVYLLFDELEFRSLIPRLSLRNKEQKAKESRIKNTSEMKQKNHVIEQTSLF